jgi:hypothetical protein
MKMWILIIVLVIACITILSFVKDDICEVCRKCKGTKQYIGLGKYKMVCSECAIKEIKKNHPQMVENYKKNNRL